MFEDDNMLTAALIIDLKVIINDVAEKLVKILQKKIKEIVYDPYDPLEYQRQFKDGLYGMWDNTPPTVTGLREPTVRSEINEYPNIMTLDPDEFIHGSRYWYVDDIREILTEIVVEGRSGDFFGDRGFWTQPRDFWQPFIELLEDGTVDRMIEAGFRKRGIKYIRM